ncbi:hypothetical protein DYU05_00790 [Mucilaginibacter terrenus]|uniref:Uncharacterized protein n=1 Tax=Mucilaginibacter terrenus TaxID=2482727 RepID=A0A3E2NTF5_9SPHI|nr:hypothetical protein [Mucilaginibacter terrenus]RFZ84201.1 hypothetical protein DYU05_00790 [Mucilaginibacter terrenus]
MKKLLFVVLVFLSTYVFGQDIAIDTAGKPSPALRSKILKESKNSGKLDMWTPIQGHETDGIQIAPGVFATKREVAIIKWAYNLVAIGITNKKEVISIYAELIARDVNSSELKCLNYGYDQGIKRAHK